MFGIFGTISYEWVIVIMSYYELLLNWGTTNSEIDALMLNVTEN